MMQTELEHVDALIRYLQDRKNAILSEERAARSQRILSLDWARGRRAWYEENGRDRWGGTMYSLNFEATIDDEDVLGEAVPREGIKLAGESTCTEINLMLYRKIGTYKVTTSNALLFVDFVVNVQPLISPNSQRTGHAEVLNAVSQHTRT